MLTLNKVIAFSRKSFATAVRFFNIISLYI